MSWISQIPQLILEAGRARAQGQRESGQIWGQFLANLGQQVGSIPLQMAQAREMDAQSKMRNLQLQQAQREMDSQKAFEDVLKDPQNYGPDGRIDDVKVGEALKARNVGAWMHWNDLASKMQDHELAIRKTIAEIAASDANLAEKSRKAQQERDQYLGELGFNAERILDEKPDDPLHARDTALAAAARAAGNGYITEQQARDFLMQTAQASPQQMRQVFGSFVPADMRAKLEKTAAETKHLLSQSEKKPITVAPGATLVNPETMQPTYTAPPRPSTPHELAMEDIARQNAAANMIRARRPPASAAAGPTGALTTEGVDFAATEYRVTGKMPPLGMGNSQARAAIINTAAKQAQVLGQSPAQAIQKQAAYKADGASLTKITQAKSAAESFETKAMAQADLIADLSTKVPRGKWPIVNAALQSGRTNITGDENATKFANAVETFTEEYAKIMNGSTGSVAASSDSSRAASKRLINTAMNKGTMAGILEQMKWEMRQTILGYDATLAHITDRMGGAPAQAPSVVPPPGAVIEKWILKDGKLVKQ